MMLTNILGDCDGFPAPVITILRDAVDAIRMKDVEGLPTTYQDTSARILRETSRYARPTDGT